MSQNSSASSFSSSGTAQKPGYNKHFPRSFLLNYGGAIQDISEEAILSRLHDFNCEWLQRPNIALSEMAQTLRENLPILAAQTPRVLDADFVDGILVHFRPLCGHLSRLDNKDKTTSEPASREDVVALMKTITGEPELEERLREGLNAAGALFMTCIHLLVPLTLMRNPQDFADKARRTAANQRFKEDPTPRKMREFILDSVTKKRRPVPGASIWDAPDEEEEDSQPATSSRRRKSLPSAWEEERDSAGPESSQPPGRKSAVDWTSAPPSRRGKRPARPAMTSTPAKKRSKKRKPDVSSSSSSSEDSDEEERRPLASAKTAKASAPRASPGKTAASESGSKATSDKTKKKKSNKPVCLSSSPSSDTSEEDGQQTKSKTESSAQRKKACQTGKAPTSANDKAKDKAGSKGKDAAKKTKKSAATKVPDDDVWNQLGAALKQQ